ncbi:polynucleotide adenylyltransferase [Malassezia sp. CBS 17886]|nr:polynucleotide adenylyltransferase [Malassezia sp. CBS 17886]
MSANAADADRAQGPGAVDDAHGFGSADYIAFHVDDAPPQEPGGAGTKRKRAARVDDTVREHASARSTPWASLVPWHDCHNVAAMLSAEVQTYSDWVSPTAEEHACRVMVIELLQQTICKEWPDAEVRSFGSQDTQLYLPQGDIDLVVLSRTMDRWPRENTLRRLAACLRAGGVAESVQVIARAKVPIVKFVCPYGHFHVDISVNQANGLQAANLVNRWLRRQPSLRPLVMVLKQLLQQRALSEVFSGGLGSYSVTLLVLSFLQLHPKVQRGEIDPARNLGVLLMEILELYGKNFGYDDTGISVRSDGRYFAKSQRGFYDDRKPFLLCIEDPHDPFNDVARGSFAVIGVRSALGGAYDILHAALCERANDMPHFLRRQRALHHAQTQRTHTHFDDDTQVDTALQNRQPESLLGNILGVSREMLKRRREIKALYDSHVLQKRLDTMGRARVVEGRRGVAGERGVRGGRVGVEADVESGDESDSRSDVDTSDESEDESNSRSDVDTSDESEDESNSRSDVDTSDESEDESDSRSDGDTSGESGEKSSDHSDGHSHDQSHDPPPTPPRRTHAPETKRPDILRKSTVPVHRHARRVADTASAQNGSPEESKYASARRSSREQRANRRRDPFETLSAPSAARLDDAASDSDDHLTQSDASFVAASSGGDESVHGRRATSHPRTSAVTTARRAAAAATGSRYVNKRERLDYWQSKGHALGSP